MKTIKVALLTFLGAGLLLGSCSKYQDNEGVNLASKKARVENTWVVDKAFDEGQDVSGDFDQYELFLSKDGDARLDAKYEFGAFTYENKTDGTWNFEDSKETLALDFEDDDADQKYQILRLESDALWLRQKGDDLELRLKSK